MGDVTSISKKRGGPSILKDIANLPIVDEIDEMLRDEVSLADVARYIQETFEMLTQYVSHKLVSALEKRRKTLPPLPPSPEEFPAGHPIGKDEDIRAPGRIAQNQYRRAAVGMDKLLELESLYITQRDRIDKKIQGENDTGEFYDCMEDSIKTARELIKDMVGIEREFGVAMNRMRVNLDIQGASNTDLGKRVSDVMEHPESRHKVISMFKRVTQAAELPEAVADADAVLSDS